MVASGCRPFTYLICWCENLLPNGVTAVEQKPELLRKEKNELHDKHIEVREVREGISSSQIRSLEEG